MKSNMFDKILGAMSGKKAYGAPDLKEITWDLILDVEGEGGSVDPENPPGQEDDDPIVLYTPGSRDMYAMGYYEEDMEHF